MNEQKNNGRGIFYGVIGVATLVVAIIGATFAYFTATASAGANEITGNMASITFNLSVAKVTHVDETKGGMIPMSNSMVQPAVLDTGTGNAAHTCVDDNGNAVCQIYKITVNNTGSASLFLDGFVTLTGGSGTATDDAEATTTMRWAQVFCSGTETDEITGCTTAGTTTTSATGLDPASMPAIGQSAEENGHNADNILKTFAAVTSQGTISGNSYDIIDKNYIRISKHTADASYDRNADVTSALVYNQFLDPAGGTSPSQVFYIVVWLSETGTNQTASATGAGTPEGSGLSFFNGLVTFNSAQGSEVTATFSSYTAVRSDKASGSGSQQSQEPSQP